MHAAEAGQLDALNVLLQYDWSRSTRTAHPSRNAVMQQALVVAAREGHSTVCEFLVSLTAAAGADFHVDLSDSIFGETGELSSPHRGQNL